MSYLKRIIAIVNGLNDWVGRVISVVIFPMIFILLWEVILRYSFNRPTIWAHELSGMLYAVSFLLGGAYALRWKAHVNVDIVYNRFSRRTKAIIDLVSWLFFYLFCGALLLESIESALRAVLRLELSDTVWAPPIWPIKLCVPLAACLILLQGIIKTMGDFIIAFTGREDFAELFDGKEEER
jgi:TRAP-type mannitol/chloroaromatic compound transport system permease small subunit